MTHERLVLFCFETLSKREPHVGVSCSPTRVHRCVMCFSLCHQMVVPPLRKAAGGRKRQLVFADPCTQISETAMQEQIGDLLAETLHPVVKNNEMVSINGSLSSTQTSHYSCTYIREVHTHSAGAQWFTGPLNSQSLLFCDQSPAIKVSIRLGDR